LRDGIRFAPGALLALRPDENERLVRVVCKALDNDAHNVIVLPDGLTRVAARKLIELERSSVPTLTEAELLTELRGRPRRRIGGDKWPVAD
jgi:type III secretory pathway component EscV